MPTFMAERLQSTENERTHLSVQSTPLRMSGTTRSFLAGDPGIDARFQQAQRHRPVQQDGVVEAAHIEPRPQGCLRPMAQLHDLQLPNLIAERLAGPRD